MLFKLYIHIRCVCVCVCNKEEVKQQQREKIAAEYSQGSRRGHQPTLSLLLGKWKGGGGMICWLISLRVLKCIYMCALPWDAVASTVLALSSRLHLMGPAWVAKGKGGGQEVMHLDGQHLKTSQLWASSNDPFNRKGGGGDILPPLWLFKPHNKTQKLRRLE